MSIPTILPSGRLHPDQVNNVDFIKNVDGGIIAQSGQIGHKINGQISVDALKEGSERLSRDFREDRIDVINLDSFFTRRSGVTACNKAVASGGASANACDVVTISAQAKEAMAKQETQVNSAVPANEASEKQAKSGGTTFTSFAEQFSKMIEVYANTIREHYAAEHEERLRSNIVTTRPGAAPRTTSAMTRSMRMCWRESSTGRQGPFRTRKRFCASF